MTVEPVRQQTRSARGIPPSPKRFHHGSLKQALIDAAMASDDIEGLSINQLAAGVGVTPAAIYRHFDSREALLDEVARIGFDRLGVLFSSVFDMARPPVSASEATARLKGLAHAYLQFADESPALWRLMFGTQAAAYRSKVKILFEPNSYDYLPAALMGLFVTGIVTRAPDERDALFAWSVVHGAAMLRAGQVLAALGLVSELAGDIADRVIRSLR